MMIGKQQSGVFKYIIDVWLQVLKRPEYFGKFGKIHKVVINSSTSYAGSQVSFVFFSARLVSAQTI